MNGDGPTVAHGRACGPGPQISKSRDTRWRRDACPRPLWGVNNLVGNVIPAKSRSGEVYGCTGSSRPPYWSRSRQRGAVSKSTEQGPVENPRGMHCTRCCLHRAPMRRWAGALYPYINHHRHGYAAFRRMPPPLRSASDPASVSGTGIDVGCIRCASPGARLRGSRDPCPPVAWSLCHGVGGRRHHVPASRDEGSAGPPGCGSVPCLPLCPGCRCGLVFGVVSFDSDRHRRTGDGSAACRTSPVVRPP